MNVVAPSTEMSVAIEASANIAGEEAHVAIHTAWIWHRMFPLVSGDRGQLEQAVISLSLNPIETMPTAEEWPREPVVKLNGPSLEHGPEQPPSRLPS